jgi:hypothetical protein
MYSDPKHIKSNFYKVSLNTDEQYRLEKEALSRGVQPSACIRELMIEQLNKEKQKQISVT